MTTPGIETGLGGIAGRAGAQVPVNRYGRCYHIDCGPGDLAPYIFTCGDPRRAARIARRFDSVRVRRNHRGFLTYTGRYQEIPISVMATGIGAAVSAIAVVEAAQCIAPVTFIRLGSCGALQDYIAPGDLVITSEALRDEHTTDYYAPADLTARAHPEILAALEEAALALRVPHHVGLTCTAADFYAGQGRVPPGFPTLEPQKVARLSERGVLNLEMEMSAYLTLAAVSSYPVRAGGVCAVFANRVTDAVAFAPGLIRQAEQRLIEVGLRALEILAGKDRREGIGEGG